MNEPRPPGDGDDTPRPDNAEAPEHEPLRLDHGDAGFGNDGDPPDEHDGEREPPARRGGGLLTAAALLLAVVAVALAAALWWQQQELAQRLDGADPASAEAVTALGERIDALAGDMAGLDRQLRGAVDEALEGQLDGLRVALRDAERDLSTLRDDLASQHRTLQRLGEDVDAWPARFRDLRDSVADLRGVSDDARARWLRAEAEYFINLGYAELQLGRSVERALHALEIADSRLRDAAEPALNTVRAALAGEIEALRAVPELDREGLSLRLATLAGRIDELPLPAPLPTGYARGAGPVDPERTQAGLERAWAALRGALASLVSVRRSEEALSPQLAPEEAFFLRRNLELQIEGARLALLQHRPGVYRDNLEAASQWLEAWFDADDPAVVGVREALDELAEVNIAPELPPVGESLRRLRAAGDSGR